MPKVDFISVLLYVGFALLILLAIGIVVLKVYAVLVYGNTPIYECPTWVVWLLEIGK